MSAFDLRSMLEQGGFKPHCIDGVLTDDLVIIDHCAVPGPLYRQVKAEARDTRSMRFIAVKGNPAGGHCGFEVFTKRDEVPAGCCMVLWISPRGD